MPPVQPRGGREGVLVGDVVTASPMSRYALMYAWIHSPAEAMQLDMCGHVATEIAVG